MDESISAADANRNFSRLLREVSEGRSFTVTSHGRPVARIVPPDAERDARADAAWQRLLKRLEQQPAQNIGPWTREELYED